MEKADMVKAQKANIRKKASLSALTVGLVLVLGYRYAPIHVPALPGVGERLAYTLRWQIFSFIILVWAIMKVAMARANSQAADSVSGKDSQAVALQVQFYSNTMDQFICSFSAQLILTTFLEEEQMKIIPLLVLLFVLSRVTFWIGFQSPELNRTNRAYGFGINVLTNLLVSGYLLYRFGLELLGF